MVAILAVQLAVWGSFLVPLRIGGAAVPLCWIVAVVGNIGLGFAAGRLGGVVGAVLPGALWLIVAGVLGTVRAEGDLIVVGSVSGSGFLLLGVLGSVLAVALSGRRRGRRG